MMREPGKASKVSKPKFEQQEEEQEVEEEKNQE